MKTMAIAALVAICTFLVTAMLFKPIEGLLTDWGNAKIEILKQVIEKRKILKLVRVYWNSGEDFTFEKCQWIGNGKKYFSVTYDLQSSGDERLVRAIDVFRFADGQLFLEIQQKSDNATFFADWSELEGKEVLLLGRNEYGSGGFIEFTVYKIDSKHGFEKAFDSGELFKGSVQKIDNIFYVKGNSQKFSIVSNDGVVSLLKVKNKMKHDEASGLNILSYKIDRRDNFVISYNGVPLEFEKSGEKYVLEEPIEIGANERIVLDDGLDSKQAVRTMYDGSPNLDFRDGIFKSLVSNGPGVGQLTVNKNYSEEWFTIPIKTTSEIREIKIR